MPSGGRGGRRAFRLAAVDGGRRRAAAERRRRWRRRRRALEFAARSPSHETHHTRLHHQHRHLLNSDRGTHAHAHLPSDARRTRRNSTAQAHITRARARLGLELSALSGARRAKRQGRTRRARKMATRPPTSTIFGELTLSPDAAAPRSLWVLRDERRPLGTPFCSRPPPPPNHNHNPNVNTHPPTPTLTHTQSATSPLT
jgi:hypothetical protein